MTYRGSGAGKSASAAAVLAALTLAAAILLSGCGILQELLTPPAGSAELPPVTTAEIAQSTPPSIPFDAAPEIPEYELPPEEFADELEREASEIIDFAIARALAYLSVLRDGRHSDTVFAFDEDANGYIAKLNLADRELYRRFIEAGRQFGQYTITETEYEALAAEYPDGTPHELKDAFFALFEPMCYCEPGLSSYYDVDGRSYISDADDSSHMRSMFSYYFDPNADQNVQVADGAVSLPEVRRDAELLERVVRRVVRFMPEGLSAYDRYYYLAAVLSEKVSYDDRPDNCFTAFGALIGGKAVCEGYTSAYYLLCREAGLWCAYRNGQPNGAGHTWNMVKLDSGIYNVDVTWCDGKGSPYERAWYNCFMCSDAAFEADGHCATSGVAGTGEYEPSPYGK